MPEERQRLVSLAPRYTAGFTTLDPLPDGVDVFQIVVTDLPAGSSLALWFQAAFDLSGQRYVDVRGFAELSEQRDMFWSDRLAVYGLNQRIRWAITPSDPATPITFAVDRFRPW